MLKAIAAAALASLCAGCGASVSRCSSSAGLTATVDDVFLAINEDVPGFGGLVMEGDHHLVWLTDLAASATAEAKIPGHMAGFDLVSRPMTFRQGQYAWKQLMAWRVALENGGGVFAGSGVTTSDTDEGRNRVAIGVSDLQYEAEVRQSATRLGVPNEALVVERVLIRLANGNCGR